MNTKLFGSAVVSIGALVALGTASPALAIGSFFDVFADFVQGPPYPTGQTGVHVLNDHNPGGNPMISNDADFGMGLRTLSLNGLPPGTPVLGQLHALNGDSGGPGGNFHIDSFFDVFVDIQQAPPGQFVESFFDIFTELSVPGVAGNPMPMPVSPPMFADSFFDIFVEVQLPTGLQPLHLHGQTAPGVHINPGSHPDFPADSFFDIFFDITIDRSVYSPSTPELRITLDSQLPAPGAAGLLALGGVMALRRRR